MSDYSACRDIQIPAEKAYTLLADWGDTTWISGPERTEISREGSKITRHLFMPGGRSVKETLLSADPRTTTLRYTIAPGELFTLQDYHGTIIVTPTGNGCRIAWSCSFALGEMKPDDAQAIANRNLNFLLDSVCRHLEG